MAQLTQIVADALPWKVPALQLVHIEAAAAEYVPAEQPEHTEGENPPMVLEKVPEEQLVQLVDAVLT